MNPFQRLCCSSGLILLGLVFSVTGCAETAVHRHGGSTAVVTQSGGGTRTTEVYRSRDGQKVITRDGNSTDVTVQRGGSAPSTGSGTTASARSAEDRFARQDRFSQRGRFAPGTPDCGSDCGASPESRARGGIPTAAEYKQRMLDRMRPLSSER